MAYRVAQQWLCLHPQSTRSSLIDELLANPILSSSDLKEVSPNRRLASGGSDGRKAFDRRVSGLYWLRGLVCSWTVMTCRGAIYIYIYTHTHTYLSRAPFQIETKSSELIYCLNLVQSASTSSPSPLSRISFTCLHASSLTATVLLCCWQLHTLPSPNLKQTPQPCTNLHKSLNPKPIRATKPQTLRPNQVYP